jgi:hypothetical protein
LTPLRVFECITICTDHVRRTQSREAEAEAEAGRTHLGGEPLVLVPGGDHVHADLELRLALAAVHLGTTLTHSLTH